MGNHRRPGAGRRGVWGTVLAGATIVAGAAVLLLALTRIDGPPSDLAATPGPTPAPAVPAPAVPASFVGTWAGPLADPDTTTVDVRLTVAGAGAGVRLDVPTPACSYRGADPLPAPGDAGAVTTELRAEAGPADRCVESARVRIVRAGPARVRYDLLESCDVSACTARRATGVLAAAPGS